MVWRCILEIQALKFRQRGLDITKASLSNIGVSSVAYQGGFNSVNQNNENPYKLDNGIGWQRGYRLAFIIFINNKQRWQIKDYFQD